MRIPSEIAAEIREATRATPTGVSRVRARVRDTMGLGETHALLRGVPPVAHGAEERVRRRVLATLEERRRPQRARWAVGVGALGLAAAAGLAFLVVAPMSHPDDPDAPLDTALRSVGALQSLQPSRHVKLHYDGVGELSGTEAAPVIAWRSGVLEVEVEKGAGVDLRVRTREGEVRVIGTAFRVSRDVLGTGIEVERGVVEVTCEGSAPVRLTAAEGSLCVPTSAAGLLGRARALHGAGDEVGAVGAASAGLTLAGHGDPAWGELVAVQTEIHEAAGRRAEALALAERYLASGAMVRRAEMLHLAANAAHAVGGCERALPHLRTLRAVGDLTADERSALEHCEQGS